jgi:acetoin utilization protein AcuB
MLVGQRMSKHPVVCSPDMPVDEALNFMRQEKVRRLPVIGKERELLGIVSEKDLLYVSPSPATTLSVFEMHYLLSKIKVADVMSKNVITVTEDTPLEEAARIMADNKIGGLPVLRGDKLVGIITETDLFKVFLELLGAREPGCRVSAIVPETKGLLAKLTAAISAKGGDFVSIGTFLGDDPTNRMVVFKVREVDEAEVRAALETVGAKDVNILMSCSV